MNILSFTELSDDSVGRIFTTILGAFLQRNFGADTSSLADKASSESVLQDTRQDRPKA
jgi:dynein heavy chain